MPTTLGCKDIEIRQKGDYSSNIQSFLPLYVYFIVQICCCTRRSAWYSNRTGILNHIYTVLALLVHMSSGTFNFKYLNSFTFWSIIKQSLNLRRVGFLYFFIQNAYDKK